MTQNKVAGGIEKDLKLIGIKRWRKKVWAIVLKKALVKL
jgi:hypothetical protein